MSNPSSYPGLKTESPPEPHPDRFEIKVSSLAPEEQSRVLKHGETFAVFDRHGDINPLGQRGEAGIYHAGTRFLSRMMMTIDGAIPMLLNSAVDEENVVLTTDLTNAQTDRLSPADAPQQTLHVQRSKVLFDAACHEQIQITSFAEQAVRAVITFHLGADFADLFEVRGMRRKKRGVLPPAETTDDGLILSYIGLDAVLRRTEILTEPRPTAVENGRISFDLRIAPQEVHEICLSILCRSADAPCGERLSFDGVRERVHREVNDIADRAARVRTSNEQFNLWLSRSYADLFMMLSNTPHGLYPYAGVPWYNTVFGRDGIITALECLWMIPQVARGVLTLLAAQQADSRDPKRDASPGKILHETRSGEMAALHEIPFGKYYGSVDATPLFVYLASEYLVRTADREYAAQLWPHVERALDWMSEYGDVDGDGFLEYRRETSEGLANQGWKDSSDSVFHADGREARHPIALCEVQAYAYAAYVGAARMARELGHLRRAEGLASRALELRNRFNKAFWLEDLGTYALALDGEKKPCRVRASNAGHCLYCGIAERRQAERVTRTLLDGHSFCGWGVRTVDDREARFNPMSYHNGSVWPHDNALIALGFSRYGFMDEANRILSDLFSAATFMELYRLPELFCGFPRRRAQGPTLYPVACSPQVWASAAVFCMLAASMGLRIDALNNRVLFVNPRLPHMLNHINVLDLRVGQTSVDIRLNRFDGDVGLHVIRKDGDAELAVLK